MKTTDKKIGSGRVLGTKRGFSILELVIATFILTVGILAALNLITATIRYSIETRGQIIASGLAQEGVELVRNVRDKNMLTQLSNLGLPWNETFKQNLPQAGGIGQKCTVDFRTNPVSTNCASIDPKLYLDSGKRYVHTSGGNEPTLFNRYFWVSYTNNAQGNVTGMEVTVRVWWGEEDPATCDFKNKCLEVRDYLPKRD